MMNMVISLTNTRMTTTTTPNNERRHFRAFREGLRGLFSMHMNQLDNDGYCAESDDYVVALHFVGMSISSP